MPGGMQKPLTQDEQFPIKDVPFSFTDVPLYIKAKNASAGEKKEVKMTIICEVNSHWNVDIVSSARTSSTYMASLPHLLDEKQIQLFFLWSYGCYIQGKCCVVLWHIDIAL